MKREQKIPELTLEQPHIVAPETLSRPTVGLTGAA